MGSIILEAKNELQRLEDENFWSNLSVEKIEFLRNFVKPLLRTVSDADFKAMRFEKDILEVSLAHLTDEKENFIQKIFPEHVTAIVNELNVLNEEEHYQLQRMCKEIKMKKIK